MKRVHLMSATALCALALSLAACNQNTPTADSGNNNTVSAVKDATTGAVAKVDAEITSSTQGFVQAAAMSDMYEVMAGKVALTRSHSDDVKKFAQQMIDAHTMSTAGLMMAISQSNANVTVPTELDSSHQSLLNDLTGAKDEDFDARYISQQTDAHSAALTLMTGYAKDGDNPTIKAFAQMTEPVVQMHLDMIKMIKASK